MLFLQKGLFVHRFMFLAWIHFLCKCVGPKFSINFDIAPALGKTCTKHDSKSGNRQVNQVQCDSGDEASAFPINFNGEIACEDNVVMVKIDGTTTSMLVDSGAQSTVLGKKQFDNLVRNGLKVKLKPEERNLRVYGNGYLPVVGKFEASIQCFGRKTMQTILVTQGGTVFTWQFRS